MSIGEPEDDARLRRLIPDQLADPLLADAGFQVLGIESQMPVVEMLKKSIPHFYEAGLANQLRAHIGRNLNVENSLTDSSCDVYIVSVGTPIDENHQPIMGFVEEACRAIGRVENTFFLCEAVPTRHDDSDVIRSTMIDCQLH